MKYTLTTSFIAIDEKAGIMQNQSKYSNVEFAVADDGDTPAVGSGIYIKPRAKLKFSVSSTQNVYVRMVSINGSDSNNCIGVVADTPVSGGGSGSGGGSYVLPTATSTIKGGVKVGDTLIINNGVLDTKGNAILTWTSGSSYKVGDLVIKDSKIYQCATSNSDTTFNSTKWTELSQCEYRPIKDWVGAKEYIIGDIAIKDNKFYKCTTGNNDSVFNESKWEEVSACDYKPIKDWEGTKSYEVGDLAIKDNKLYKCTTANADNSFTENKWQVISYDSVEEYRLWDKFISNKQYSYGDCVRTADTPSGMYWEVTPEKVSDWQENHYYSVGDRVMYNNAIYICSTAHTSTNAYNGNYFTKTTIAGTSDAAPTGSTEGVYFTSGNITFVLKHLGGSDNSQSTSKNSVPWIANTNYNVDDLVTYEGSLFICKKTHTSSVDFTSDNNKGYWKQVDSDITTVTSNGYIQVTKTNVTAPKSYTLPITNTKTYCLPPVEVLKFTSGGTAQETSMTFNVADKDSFDDNTYVEFDGTMHEKTLYPLAYENSAVEGNYIKITTDFFNVTDFKEIKEVLL